jgi:hypothetical protein
MAELPSYFFPAKWDILGLPQPPLAWQAPSTGGQWGGAKATGRNIYEELGGLETTAKLGQDYYDWLFLRLKTLQYMKEMDEDTVKKILVDVADAIDSGQSLVSLPYFSDEFYPAYQSMYGQQGAAMTPEETANINAQTDYLRAQIAQMAFEQEQYGKISPDTQATVDVALRQLEETARQYNLGNELGWANYNLSKQQVEQQRNEYLANLQASPANWMERWYAERLPWGGSKLPLGSDKILAQGAVSPTTSASWTTSATASLPTTTRGATYAVGPGIR